MFWGGGGRFGRAYSLGLGGAGFIPEGECEFYVKFVAAGRYRTMLLCGIRA